MQNENTLKPESLGLQLCCRSLPEAQAFRAARELSPSIWPLHMQSLQSQPSCSNEAPNGSGPVLESLLLAD